jgi:large subunit ribosomal protein L4
MLKIDAYSAKGTKLTTGVTLPKEWEEKMNSALLSQAIRVYTDRAHFGLHRAQTRSDVNRTTKKVYKQKGTGGARHGARSAPIFVGGGVAHGPTGLARVLTLPIVIKRKATGIAMTQAVKDKRVIAGDLDFKKTNDTNKFVEKVIGKKQPRVLFVTKKENLKVVKFIRNIKNVKAINFMDLNAYEIFYGGNIVLDKEIFKK